MDYTLTDIKVELFDKCHDLVYEYMNRHAPQIKGESLEDYHTRFGEVMDKIWRELARV